LANLSLADNTYKIWVILFAQTWMLIKTRERVYRSLLTDKQQFRGVLPSPLLGLGVSEWIGLSSNPLGARSDSLDMARFPMLAGWLLVCCSLHTISTMSGIPTVVSNRRTLRRYMECMVYLLWRGKQYKAC
jgi:hypothetical protein